MVRLVRLLFRLAVDDAGQDLIEYALLGGFLGVAGFVIFSELRVTMGTAYVRWVSAVDVASDPPDPLP